MSLENAGSVAKLCPLLTPRDKVCVHKMSQHRTKGRQDGVSGAFRQLGQEGSFLSRERL